MNKGRRRGLPVHAVGKRLTFHLGKGVAETSGASVFMILKVNQTSKLRFLNHFKTNAMKLL